MMSLTVTVGDNVNISQQHLNQHETAIAVNPLNPKNLFAVSNQNFGDNPDHLLFGKYSMDGGKTWHAPVTPLGVAPLPPADLDPNVVFDKFGDLFVSYEQAPQGETIAVVMSRDGGRRFEDKDSRFINDFHNFTDFPQLAVGPAGPGSDESSIWVLFAGTATGKVLDSHAIIDGPGQVGFFSPPTPVPFPEGVTAANFGDIAVGPDGQVAAAFENIPRPASFDSSDKTSLTAGDLYVTVNPDGVGGKFGPAKLVTTTNARFPLFLDATINQHRLSAAPFLAYDDSRGPFHGRLYLSYLDSPAVHSQRMSVYVKYSDDNGLNWSDPTPVSTGDRGSAFLPSISVDPVSGLVGESWYDSRNAVTQKGAQLFASFSDTGGKTFSPNVVVSKGISVDARSNPTDSASHLGYGDYVKNAFYDHVFHPSWADNSNSTGNNPDGMTYLDVYTVRVEVRTSS
jgi:hypothetical protein